jgi:hypothetical protein
MNADDVIESYVGDTVRLLPRRQRDDVAAELRTLLHDELSDRAQESGRPPDKAMALELVRGYGRPNEAAARYHPAWTIIDPADNTSFTRAAVIGTGALLLLSGFRRLLPPRTRADDDQVTLAILSWLGFLLVVFAVRSWNRRRWPKRALWKPRDRDRASRVGAALLIPVATFFIIFYGAPKWVLDQISRGRFDTSWAAYSADFQQFRLPWFLAGMIGLVALVVFAAVQGRWSRLTRRIDIGLNLAIALLLLAFAAEGNVFESSAVDQIARNVMAVIGAIYVPCVGALIYGEIGRIDRVAATKGARSSMPDF